MKITNLILITAIFTVTAITSFAADPVGTIVSLTGKATATAQNGESRNLELKSPVLLNDRIKTDAAASLQIMFLDDSVVSQGEKSEMTIDEYVYNPKVKADNKCTLNLTKGAFRAITARITALNPDRFKVKTRMATIGIRGCELAFTVSQTSENIYVLSLPDGKSINVTINPDTAAGMNLTGVVNKEAAIEILQAGTMIAIQEGEGITQRFITPQEAVDLIEQLTAPDGPAGNPPPPPDENTSAIIETVVSEITDLANQELLEDIQQDILTELQNLPPETVETAETILEEVISTAASLEYTQLGTGTDWEWGVWALPAQPPQMADFIGHAVLTPGDVASLSIGLQRFLMEGPNTATAAIIKYGGSSYYVDGNCTAQVMIGMGSGNSWQVVGSAMDTGESISLNYLFEGSIVGGVLVADPIAGGNYTLTGIGPGYTEADINTQTISANLTGTGSVNPPTGIIGHFTITHDGGATIVTGGFGADLGGMP